MRMVEEDGTSPSRASGIGRSVMEEQWRVVASASHAVRPDDCVPDVTMGTVEGPRAFLAQAWIASRVTRRAWIRQMTRVSRARCSIG